MCILRRVAKSPWYFLRSDAVSFLSISDHLTKVAYVQSMIYLESTPVIHSYIADGLRTQYKREGTKHKMKWMKPCADEVLSEKEVHIPQPSFMAFHLEIRWHRRICDDWPNGWLQCPAGDVACQDQPSRGRHMGLMCRGFHSPYGSCQREARV